MRRAKMSVPTLAYAVVCGAVVLAFLLAVEPLLAKGWLRILLYWAEALNLPLRAGEVGAGSLSWIGQNGNTQLPQRTVFVGSAVATIALWGATLRMSDSLTPLAYLVRILCAVQASALAYFSFFPSQFPYTVPGHLTTMLASGSSVLVSIGTLMAATYASLRVPIRTLLAHVGLVVAYFILMLPHQVLLHAIVLQHLSVLLMPVLYLCFGSVFQVVVFVALFSWLLSSAPQPRFS